MDSLVPDEDAGFEHARIYHRYHITGLPNPDSDGNITAIHQLPLQFISHNDQRAVIESLVSGRNTDDALLHDRLREVATQESTRLKSELTLAPSDRYPGFQLYQARHEERAKRLIVNLFDTDISNPKQVHKFRVFQVVGSERDVYLANAPVELADALLRQIGKSARPAMQVKYPHVDLQRLANDGSTHIRGGSFKIKGRPKLTTAMVFGPGVNEDDSWEEYSRIGELSYIHLQLSFDESDLRMMVTSRGSLLPYGINDIAKELRLCTLVYDQFIKQFVTGETNLRMDR